MKKLSLLLVLILSLASISVFYLASSMIRQEANPLLLLVNSADETQKLEVFNAHTGEQQFITNLGHYYDAGWLPDGRIWVLDNGDVEDSNYSLHLFDTKTSIVSTISTAAYYWGCGQGISWSPNGNHLVYITWTDPNFSINIVNLVNETSYTIPVSREGIFFPRWSADGRYMLVNDVDGTRLYKADNGEQLMSDTDLLYASFSPDSRFLVYFNDNRVIFYELATSISTNLEDTNVIGWSPSGRYRAISYNRDTSSYTYYDAETDNRYPINLEMRHHLAAWSQDETHLFLYTNFPNEYSPDNPKNLISYELATGEVETILETQGIIHRIFPNGDWLAVIYINRMSEDYSTPISILVTNGETLITQEIASDGIMAYELAYLEIEWSPNGRWLSIPGYMFDTQTAQFEATPIGEGSHFWSPDSNYLAFYTGLWNMERKATEELPLSARVRIIGWQGSSEGNFLVCGEM